MKRLRRIEVLFWCVGIALLSGYGGMRVHGRVVQQRDLARFAALQATPSSTTGDLAEPTPSAFALWSPQRIDAYEKARESDSVHPVAVLRIPSVAIEVAVLEGTADLTLDRGVGHIEGTALPGRPGNLGIAGHRDGFFRGLKDIAPGDRIELSTLERTFTYVVDELRVVDPEDVSVLAPTDAPTITLVTCYPFYFAGSAPQRFIVSGKRVTSSEETDSGS